MSKQSNPTLIGAFILGGIALVIGGLLAFGSGDFFEKKLEYVMYFSGSVKGLDVGAPVALRGVNVGSVKRVEAQVDSEKLDFLIAAYVEIIPGLLRTISSDAKRPRTADSPQMQALWKKGLRAQLQMQSLVTGKLFIDLDFHPDSKARYFRKGSHYVEFPTVESAFEKIADTLKNLPLDKIVHKVVSILDRVDEIVESKKIDSIIDNVDGTMAGANALVADLRGDAKGLAGSAEAVLADAKSAIKRIERLAADVDAKVAPVSAKLEGALADARTLLNHVNDKVDPVSSSFIGALDQGKTTLASVDELVGSRSTMRNDFEDLIHELSRAARSIRVLADYLERHPDALLRGKHKGGGQ